MANWQYMYFNTTSKSISLHHFAQLKIPIMGVISDINCSLINL